jgi:hypothetical protein
MSTEHNVTTYIVRLHSEGMKPMLPNCRLSVIRWKATKDKAGTIIPARRSMAVEVPNLELSVTPAVLQTALSAAYLELQDEFIRSKVEEALEAKRENIFFTFQDFQPESLAAYLSEKATSGKLSGDVIATWFDANLADNLEEAFAAKEDVTDDQIKKALKDYRESFSKLASPAWAPPIKIVKQLHSALQKAASDKVTSQLESRLTKMLAPKTESLELSL